VKRQLLCQRLKTRFAQVGAVCILAAVALPVVATAASRAQIVGQPELYVAKPTSRGQNTTAAWIVFRTSKRLKEPRLIVAQAAGRAGRSYRASGSPTCIRSSILTSDGHIALREGHQYRVTFYERQGTGVSRPRIQFATRTVVARSFSIPRGTHAVPNCATRQATLSGIAAMDAGIKKFASLHDARASRLRVTCGAVKEVGQSAPCSGSFRLTRNQQTAIYTLSRRASVFRNTPDSVEYRLSAVANRGLPGLPSDTGRFTGYLQ
jgi:hypothetical protein